MPVSRERLRRTDRVAGWKSAAPRTRRRRRVGSGRDCVGKPGLRADLERRGGGLCSNAPGRAQVGIGRRNFASGGGARRCERRDSSRGRPDSAQRQYGAAAWVRCAQMRPGEPKPVGSRCEAGGTLRGGGGAAIRSSRTEDFSAMKLSADSRRPTRYELDSIDLPSGCVCTAVD